MTLLSDTWSPSHLVVASRCPFCWILCFILADIFQPHVWSSSQIKLFNEMRQLCYLLQWLDTSSGREMAITGCHQKMFLLRLNWYRFASVYRAAGEYVESDTNLVIFADICPEDKFLSPQRNKCDGWTKLNVLQWILHMKRCVFC